ncbi:hypothetical protein [Micromonospora profundi]|uniref:Flagellar basal body-associated protein FliL n=1 Tax=Micromonospora profundi TaxID=1420889 RepID=A0AAJ6HRN7_9ACTN|nr:hypothetical protein [Micromonospora profundi]WLS45546.1 hypothetical protein Q3V37_30060 [Micromonospora profundi]
MSQPPANPFGPPHDPPPQPQGPQYQPGPPQQPGPQYQPPQQPAGWPPPQQQGFGPAQPGSGPAQPGQPYGHPNLAVGPPPKKSNVGTIAVIALAAVLVLCLGGAAVTWFVVKDGAGDVVEASRTKVVAPDTLAGRPRYTEPDLRNVVDATLNSIRPSVQNETGAVGEFYGEPILRDFIQVAAVSGVVADPQRKLDDAVSWLPQLALTGLTATEPGPLGGDARCGNGRTNGVPIGVCLWADEGSVGLVLMYYRSAEQVIAEFVGIRGQIEQRS